MPFRLFGAKLREGENELELENAGDTGAPYSMIMLDRFSISYPGRDLDGIRGAAVRPGRSGTASFENRDTFVLEVSGDEPLWLEGTAGGFRVEADRDYLVVGSERVERPPLRGASPPRLRDPRRGPTTSSSHLEAFERRWSRSRS